MNVKKVKDILDKYPDDYKVCIFKELDNSIFKLIDIDKVDEDALLHCVIIHLEE